MSVTDQATALLATSGFNDHDQIGNYTYDANGNLKSDSYKGITSIVYNHLNLPTSIQWGTTKKIEVQYDAAGAQLSRTVYTGATIDYKQDYVAGVEYRTVGATRKAESIFHAEGRRYNTNVNTGNSTEVWRVEYSIRDHLGNSRLTFTDKDNNGKIDVTTTSANEILSEQHYYPFGLSYGGTLWMNDAGDVDNRYLFNGIERNEDLGLNWDLATFRSYDAVIGRWLQVDPQAEKYYSMTPYNGMGNNPITISDPAGDTLRAVSKTSAQRALGLIRSGLPSPLTANNLFSIGSDGVTFNPISGEALSNALVGLPTDQAALVIGYAAMINGPETNVVEVVNRGETISEYGQKALGGGIKTGSDLDAVSGGGQAGQAYYDGNIVRLGADGTYGIVTANSQVKLDYNDGSRLGLPGETLYMTRSGLGKSQTTSVSICRTRRALASPKLFDVGIAHELLGHGLGSRGGRSDGQQIDAAIQAGNIYLRTQGKTYYRPDHGVTNHTKEFNPNAIPNYLSRFRF